MNVMPDDFMADPPVAPMGHATVLCDEVRSALDPHPGGVYVDATLGGGGHTEAILTAVEGAMVLAIDQDESAIETARHRLARFGTAVRFVHGRFSELAQHVEAAGLDRIDGIVADLGISSLQLDDPSRGLSFRNEGPLDMRMGEASEETALELIERLSNDELADVLYQYGDERRSRRIARCIQQALKAGELKTTLDLRRAVVRAVGPARVGGIDPATRTFQALRIAVNRELEELEALLVSAPGALSPGGVLAIISFHSLEDRMVKRAFLDPAVWQRLTPKPIIASKAETERNPRSRSAKLRVARKVAS